MLFNSPTFLFFYLPACIFIYFLLPTLGWKNAFLLGVSWIFYAWGEPVYIALMLTMTAFNYAAARLMDATSGRRRKIALALTVTGNLLVLATFKYAAFAATSWNAVFAPGGLALPVPKIPLPLGISFFTFHALSYVIDVYRRRFAANRSFREMALYIAFFPQLIAGPIVRYNTIAGRLRRRRHTLGRASAGLRIFVLGLAQKLLLADNLAPLANAVFDHASHPSLAESWLGATAYALQIYFDFAGYSAMAIGLGLVFGFRLPRNFRRPYASKSITEFWRRWHISLSSWFRDYLYVPLGGNRGPAWKTWRNLIIVFLLCGLWHGASWTFVLWGAWHGAFLVIERAGLGGALRRLPRPLAWAYAMVVVLGAWVLFRSADLSRALDIWAGMAGFHGIETISPQVRLELTDQLQWLLPVAALLSVARLPRRGRPASARLAVWSDNTVVGVLAGLSVLQVAAGTYSPFLYFRF